MTRRLVCLSVPSLAALTLGEYVLPGRHYALLLLLDARDLDAAIIGTVADRLLQQGLVDFHAWGPDCERVHDIMDESAVERDIRDDYEYPVIMTGWYADYPLKEALWGTLHPIIDDAYRETFNTTIVVTVANADWDRDVRRLLRELSSAD